MCTLPRRATWEVPGPVRQLWGGRVTQDRAFPWEGAGETGKQAQEWLFGAFQRAPGHRSVLAVQYRPWVTEGWWPVARVRASGGGRGVGSGLGGLHLKGALLREGEVSVSRTRGPWAVRPSGQ